MGKSCSTPRRYEISFRSKHSIDSLGRALCLTFSLRLIPIVLSVGLELVLTPILSLLPIPIPIPIFYVIFSLTFTLILSLNLSLSLLILTITITLTLGLILQ